MSDKKYRIWTTLKDGSENGRWDGMVPIPCSKEECEAIIQRWSKHPVITTRETHEVREYLGDSEP